MSRQADRSGGTVPVLLPDAPDTRQERRDAAENRKRVLEAAQRLFEASGVESVSMHQIAQAAGVGQGTLYRHYPHKGELCRDLLAETVQRFRQDVEEYLATSGAGTPALARLNGVLERYVEILDTKISLLTAIGDACWGQRRAEKFQSAAYLWMNGMIATLLNEAVANGELRALDPTFTADALLAALSPDVYQFQREARGLTPQEILQRVSRIFAANPTKAPTSAPVRQDTSDVVR